MKPLVTEDVTLTAANKVNTLLSASQDDLGRMLDDWASGISTDLKRKLIKTMSVGE